MFSDVENQLSALRMLQSRVDRLSFWSLLLLTRTELARALTFNLALTITLQARSKSRLYYVGASRVMRSRSSTIPGTAGYVS